jgi:hypothetical protein
MRTLPWRRSDMIDQIRSEVWLYLTPSAAIETELLQASALLRMPVSEIQAVAQLQFLASQELGRLIDQLPTLTRRLSTTTVSEEEWSTERIRGSIRWSTTLSMRAATGLPHLYVTQPARRAFQTPENELLVFLLDETVRLGKLTGWYRSSSEVVGRLLSERVAVAERWRQARALGEVERRPIGRSKITRIRSGRHRRRYEAVLDAWDVYKDLVGRLDRQAIRHAVESHGLVTRDDPTLFELVVTFRIIDEIRNAGWLTSPLRLWQGSLGLKATRGAELLWLYYQHAPPALRRGSHYGQVQRAHGLSVGGLIPDLVLSRPGHDPSPWLLVEVKGGHRRVEQSARAALLDLLAYRRAFEPALAGCRRYGLGVAFGAQLTPDEGSEITLATPDVMSEALAAFLD